MPKVGSLLSTSSTIALDWDTRALGFYFTPIGVSATASGGWKMSGVLQNGPRIGPYQAVSFDPTSACPLAGETKDGRLRILGELEARGLLTSIDRHMDEAPTAAAQLASVRADIQTFYERLTGTTSASPNGPLEASGVMRLPTSEAWHGSELIGSSGYPAVNLGVMIHRQASHDLLLTFTLPNGQLCRTLASQAQSEAPFRVRSAQLKIEGSVVKLPNGRLAINVTSAVVDGYRSSPKNPAITF